MALNLETHLQWKIGDALTLRYVRVATCDVTAPNCGMWINGPRPTPEPNIIVVGYFALGVQTSNGLPPGGPIWKQRLIYVRSTPDRIFDGQVRLDGIDMPWQQEPKYPGTAICDPTKLAVGLPFGDSFSYQEPSPTVRATWQRRMQNFQNGFFHGLY